MRAGILAEFRAPEDVARAARELQRRGYRRLDAFSPYPSLAIEESLHLPRSRIGWIVFPLALAGAGLAYLIQLWCNAYAYPLNVGGRPLHWAPAFIPITFEMGVLTTAIAGIAAFLSLSGLPRLHAPVFDVEGFERASIDRFWIGVDERDPAFDEVSLERDLIELGAIAIRRARRRPR